MKLFHLVLLTAAFTGAFFSASAEVWPADRDRAELEWIEELDTCRHTAILEAKVNVAYDSIIYTWYFEGGMINESTPTIEVDEFGQYAVDIYTMLDGIAQVTQQTFVFQGQTLEIEEIIVKNTSCDESNGSVRIRVNEESGVRYSLNGVDFQEGDLFDNLAAGSYTITVLNNFDCKDSQAVVIGSGSLPVIEKIESLPAGCGEENGGILFEISGGTGLITPLIDKDAFVFGNSFQDLAPGDYVVTFTDEAGCMVSSTINVVQLPCSIYVPNVFSPNGDGINDLFQINTRPGLNGRISTYMIFDRWGTPLYKAQEFSIDSSSQWWDGTYKNKKVATGIYLYYLEVEFEKGERETLQGTVQVVH